MQPNKSPPGTSQGKKASSPKNKRKRLPPKKRDSGTIVRIKGKSFKVTKRTIRNIADLQRTTHFLIPKLSFARLIKEILMENCSYDMRIQRLALEAFQTAAEMYLVQVFEDSNLLCMHAGRITLKCEDMDLACKLRI